MLLFLKEFTLLLLPIAGLILIMDKGVTFLFEFWRWPDENPADVIIKHRRVYLASAMIAFFGMMIEWQLNGTISVFYK